jgi:PleD family two-component response regulator
MPTDYHSRMKILIVDDEPANVRLLERILELDGCTNVRGVSDSRLTLEVYEEFKPDIVLLTDSRSCRCSRRWSPKTNTSPSWS